jgi:glycosyltransferase involved in cell wall biosynthesis
MPPRNVALVIGQLHLGGAEGQLYELAVRMDRSRYVPFVVCLSEVAEPYAGRLGQQGVPVEIIPRSGHNELGRVFALARVLGRRRADLAHSFLLAANAYTYGAVTMGRLLTWSRRVPFLASSRICSPHPGRWAMAVHRRAFLAAAAVIANSRLVARYTRDMFAVPESSMRVIHNGVDLESFAHTTEGPEVHARDAARRELGAADQDILIGTLGRLARQKNLELFLEMAAGLTCATTGRRLRFVVAGDGPALPGLRAAARERGVAESVMFTGARQDVARILTAFDIFVLTSDFEGLPNAVMEAMAAARPVVATRAGGTEEVVQDGVTGYLVAPGDAAGLVKHVAWLAGDPGLRRRMGKEGRARIAAEFSVQKMVVRSMALYDEVCG